MDDAQMKARDDGDVSPRRYVVAGTDVTEHVHAVVDQAGTPSDALVARLRALLRPGQ